LASSPASGNAGATINASATLTSGGNPVVGKTITFQAGVGQVTGVTDANGVATATVPLPPAAGGSLLSAGFAGDAGFQPSGDARPVGIGKGTTTLTLTGPSTPVVSGGVSGVVATLTSGGGAPIPFKTVWFVLSGPA